VGQICLELVSLFLEKGYEKNSILWRREYCPS
jgi:hypothetical protein